MKNAFSSLFIAVAVIAAAFILGRSYNYKHKKNNIVSVTGSSFYNFSSDLVVWSASFARKSMEIKEAYAALKKDESTIRSYLKEKGIKEDEIIFSAVNTNKDIEYSFDNYGNSRSIFTGYTLTQTLTVESRDLTGVEKVSREITELLDRGIILSSQAPRYYYTKLDELKIDLLARASKDGELRAKTIAENSGSKLGKLQKASMGIFQITGQNSDEDYSWGGTFNTSSKKKTASVTLKMDFEIR